MFNAWISNFLMLAVNVCNHLLASRGAWRSCWLRNRENRIETNMKRVLPYFKGHFHPKLYPYNRLVSLFFEMMKVRVY